MLQQQDYFIKIYSISSIAKGVISLRKMKAKLSSVSKKNFLVYYVY